MDINQILVYLMGGGSVIVASWILERSKKFQAQTSANKQYIFFGVSSVLGILAWVVATYVPLEILANLAPIFTILAASFTNIFLGTKFNESDDAKGKTIVP